MKQPPIKRIVMATDFSGCAEQALEYAAFLGKACPAAVDILHVVEVPLDLHPDDVLAERYWRQRLGIPSRQISLAAEELGVDLVTLGAYGRTDLTEILLGSTAQRVVQGAPRPVLTVHPAPSRPPALSTVRHILVPVDFSLCSLDALGYAALLAAQFEALLTVFHVIEPVVPECVRDIGALTLARGEREQAALRLAEICIELRHRGIAAETVVGEGITTEAVVAEATRRGCDLIVMGTRGRRGLTRLIGGSVAEAVLRQATVPVLTVKRLHVPPDARLLSAEIRMRVGDQVPVGERTH